MDLAEKSKRTFSVSSGIFLGLCCSLIGTQAAQAASFSFTKIIENKNSFSGYYFGAGAMNDKGNVVVYGSDGGENKGIFLGDGQEVSTLFTQDMFPQFYPDPNIPDAPPAYYEIHPLLDINDKNTVLFSGSIHTQSGYSRTQGLFVAENNTVTKLADLGMNGYREASYLEDFAINNQDDLMIKTYLSGDYISPRYTVKLYDDISKINEDPTVTIVGDYDNYYRGGIVAIPSTDLNNKGSIAFSSIYRDLSVRDPETRLFLSSRNSLTSVTTNVDFYSNIAVNDREQTVFVGSNNNFEEGIFSFKDGILTNLVNDQGLFHSFELLDINNKGDIAFSATLEDTWKSGIFIGTDPVKDKVIAVGDSLFGSTVTYLSFLGNKGFNNKGQIAFIATLADGTNAVFRADPLSSSPKPVPEPTSILSLLALGLGSLSVLRQSR